MIYTATRNIVTGESGELLTAYGIEAWENGVKVASSTVPDVFFNREDAEAFAELCTELALAPEHLQDVIKDLVGK